MMRLLSNVKNTRVTNIYFLFMMALLFLSIESKGQQRGVTSQYMFDGLIINPALAGNQEQLLITGLYRNQWTNIPGAPTSQAIVAHAGIPKKSMGAGLMLSHEQIGVHRNIAVFASYAYKIKLNKSASLAMGLQGGFNNLNSNFDELTLKDQVDPLLNGVANNFNPNFGAGLFFYTERFYAGLSVPYILNNRVLTASQAFNEVKERRDYYLTSGYLIDLAKNFKIKPSFLLNVQEGDALGLDVNANVFYKDIIAFGLSYRNLVSRKSGEVIALFELKLNQNLRFGYAYDYIVSGLAPFTRGSHELALRYNIQLSQEPCHTYW